MAQSLDQFLMHCNIVTMATKTKPIRIFEADDNALTLVAGVLRRGRAEIVHAALVEYIANHREELAALFEETQRAIAAGDIEAIAKASAEALESEIDRLVAELPS